jgi:hypothetical protein
VKNNRLHFLKIKGSRSTKLIEGQKSRVAIIDQRVRVIGIVQAQPSQVAESKGQSN